MFSLTEAYQSNIFACEQSTSLSMTRSIYSPVAMEVVQLFLDVATEAASVVPVQPLPHNAHAVLTLMFVKCKVLNLGGDATTPARMALIVHYNRCLGHLRYVLTGVGRQAGR